LKGLRPDVAGEVDEELRYHFDRLVEEWVAGGMQRGEAEARARRRFGDVEAYRRSLEKIDRRRERGRRRRQVLDGIRTDVALALRRIRRSPGFAASVIVVLALGIGANAMMFGVVDRLLLSPPAHVVDADRVGHIHLRRTDRNGDVSTNRYFSYPDYQDFQRVDAFSRVAAYTETATVTLGRGAGATRIRSAKASPSLFPLLGVQPALGRFFAEADDALGAPETAVVSWEFWERHFGSDRDVLGRVLDIGEGRYTILGVTPPGFTGAELAPVDVWLSLIRSSEIENGTGCSESRNCWWVHVVARLAPDVAIPAADAQATAAHRSGRSEQIDAGRYDADASILLGSLIAANGPDAPREARVARWLAGVSLVVLLIACFNVANLFLARSMRSSRETAIRVALGVGRGRLLSQLVTESLVLAGLGAGAAVILARWGGGTLHHVLLPDVAFTDTALGGRVLVFTAVLTVLAALTSGLIPAHHASRADVTRALKVGTGVARGRSRARLSLLVAQAALSVVLLVGAGLFTRSLGRARSLDLGWDPESVTVVELQWNGTLPGEERAEVYEEALERIRRLPGVRSAGLSYTIPFWSSVGIGRPRVPGLDSFPPHPAGGPYVNKVGSGYFESMGLEILRGRTFEAPDDRTDAPPVTIISESFADWIWPDRSPIGECLHIGDADDTPCTTVVGVVENHRRDELVEAEPNLLYYLNLDHPAFRGPPQAVMAGTAPGARGIGGSIQAELRGISPLIRYINVRRLQELVDPQLRSWKLGAATFSAFGVLALLVAAWGLYAVLAFEVTLRRREIGIRSAMGAGRPRLVGLLLLHAFVPAAVGVALGLGVAAAGARFLEPLLFRVSATDIGVYLGVAGILLVVAAAAGALPAWRATRVDPTEALQAE
jgi:predicted permease